MPPEASIMSGRRPRRSIVHSATIVIRKFTVPMITFAPMAAESLCPPTCSLKMSEP